MQSQKSAEHLSALSLHSQNRGQWEGQQIPGTWGWRDEFPISAHAFPQNKDGETGNCFSKAAAAWKRLRVWLHKHPGMLLEVRSCREFCSKGTRNEETPCGFSCSSGMDPMSRPRAWI